MKKIFLVALMFSFVIVSTAGAIEAISVTDYDTVTLSKSSDPAPYCPKTKISDNDKCMKCHVMKNVNGIPEFGLIEVPRESGYELPYGISIVGVNGDLGLYYMNDATDSGSIREISQYMYDHPEFKHFIMELQSPGGSVMDAWRSAGILEEMRCKGITVETRCYGYAASAGAILFIAGDVGRRFVNPHAEIMLHKLWTFSMFKVDNPDTSEDQAKLLKHFQNNINEFIFSRTGLSKEMLDEQMFKKDWWITGAEAVDLGIADGIIK